MNFDRFRSKEVRILLAKNFVSKYRIRNIMLSDEIVGSDPGENFPN